MVSSSRSKSMTALLAFAGVALAAGLALAQAPAFLRIATGGAAGTYAPVGRLIAAAISSPPQLVVTTVASNGSIDNISNIAGGIVESGFVQADIAYWAYTATGVFAGRPRIQTLRSIANLYPERVHLVVRRAAKIGSIADLKGKRVSLDEPGSGTLLNAKAILSAFGLGERDILADYLDFSDAAAKMKEGAIDAFFFTGGFPAAAITELASAGSGIDILPIEGSPVEKLVRDFPFFAVDEIPAGAYAGVGAVRTLSVGAHWVTSSDVPADTVYVATRALWSDKARSVLDAGHPKGRAIQRETALAGLLGVPLHPGAERFYREVGWLK